MNFFRKAFDKAKDIKNDIGHGLSDAAGHVASSAKSLRDKTKDAFKRKPRAAAPPKPAKAKKEKIAQPTSGSGLLDFLLPAVPEKPAANGNAPARKPRKNKTPKS